MAESVFNVEARFRPVLVVCPKCRQQVQVASFVARPAVLGDGPFVEVFDLLAVITCGCGFAGDRVVGRSARAKKEGA